MFEVGEKVILNENIKKDYPSASGELATITRIITSSPNYQYDVELPNGDYTPVRECELNKLTYRQKELITYLYTGNEVLYTPTNEVVKILKVDLLYGQVEIEFDDCGIMVVLFNTLKEINRENDKLIEQHDKAGKFTEIGLRIGKFTDKKNKQYGSSVDATYEMIKILMERYENGNGTYTIPESLLKHILLQVRIMDKQNRIFNNPEGQNDEESQYDDITGYGLIGIDMVAAK